MEQNEHSNINKHRHIIGYGTYVLVWLALLAFTALTVSASGIHFGGLTLIIALFIAMVKSSLVLNYFMHIKYDDIIFRVYIGLGIFTLLSAILGTFSDYLFR